MTFITASCNPIQTEYVFNQFQLVIQSQNLSINLLMGIVLIIINPLVNHSIIRTDSTIDRPFNLRIIQSSTSVIQLKLLFTKFF